MQTHGQPYKNTLGIKYYASARENNKKQISENILNVNQTIFTHKHETTNWHWHWLWLCKNTRSIYELVNKRNTQKLFCPKKRWRWREMFSEDEKNSMESPVPKKNIYHLKWHCMRYVYSTDGSPIKIRPKLKADMIRWLPFARSFFVCLCACTRIWEFVCFGNFFAAENPTKQLSENRCAENSKLTFWKHRANPSTWKLRFFNL